MTSTENQVTCTICLEPLSKDANIATTACGHTFHANCLLKASQRTSACPLCRTSLFEAESNEDLESASFTAFLLEFVNTFPNDAMMGEIHDIYHNAYLNSEIASIENTPQQTMTQISDQLHIRINSYLLFAAEHIRNIENNVDNELNYLT
jgi:hypothetical protein